MPSHRLHRLLSKILLGKDSKEIDEKMDWAYRILGSRHRVIGHDPLYIFLLGYAYGLDAFEMALLHLLADYTISKEDEKQILTIYNILKKLANR